MNSDLKLRVMRVARIVKSLDRLQKRAGAYDMSPELYDRISQSLDKNPIFKKGLRDLTARHAREASNLVSKSGYKKEAHGKLYAYYMDTLRRMG